MLKESIISIIIIIVIIVGNWYSQSYAKNKINEAINELTSLEDEMTSIVLQNEEEGQIDISSQKENEKNAQIGHIQKKWDNTHESLALFLEHDELEKVEAQLASIKGFVKTKEYGQGVAEIEKCNYILQHIEDKISFKIENIF